MDTLWVIYDVFPLLGGSGLMVAPFSHSLWPNPRSPWGAEAIRNSMQVHKTVAVPSRTLAA